MKSKLQDTGKYRTNIKDQFYTSPEVAKKCIQILISKLHDASLHSPSPVLPLSSYLWVEPSAGNGAFLNNIPNTYDKIGIDIEPQCANIIKHDFLTWMPPETNQKPVIIFGNPPFGRQSSLAKSFIAHSCSFASTFMIAFILPRSFVKPSMYCAFESHFHCIHTNDVETDAFVLGGDGTPYDVPCVFQIWQKKSTPRIVAEKITEKGFQYVKFNAGDAWDIVIRRVGVYAGRCFINNGDETEYSIQSHHFIKFDKKYEKNIVDIAKKINAHTFPTNTTGPRSLSKQEINEVLNSILEGL